MLQACQRCGFLNSLCLPLDSGSVVVSTESRADTLRCIVTLRFPTAAETKKRTLISELLEESLVSIQLDPRREGVDVPEAYRGQPALCLNLSRSFHLDVFEVGRLAIEASLSFGGVRHHCVIPYSAIYSIESAALERHYFFPEDVPVELDLGPIRAALEAELEGRPDADDEGSESVGQETATDDRASEPETQGVGAPHLRLIK